MSKTKAKIRAIAQRSGCEATVISVMANTANVRLSRGGRVLHGLRIVGNPIKIGDVITIGYQDGIPYIASGPNIPTENAVPARSTGTLRGGGDAPLRSVNPLSQAGWSINDNGTIYVSGMNMYKTGKHTYGATEQIVIDPTIPVIKMYDGSAALIGAWGNVKNVYGYGIGDVYGIGLGSYASNYPNITIDSTNGMRIRHYTTTVLQFKTDGTAEITGTLKVTGSITVGTNDVILNSSGISIGYGTSDINLVKWYNGANKVGDICANYNGVDNEIIISGRYISSTTASNVVLQAFDTLAGATVLTLDGSASVINLSADITKATNSMCVGGGLHIGDVAGVNYEDDVIIDGGVSIGHATAPSAGNLDAAGNIRLDGGIYVGNKAGTVTDAGRIYLVKTETLAAGQADDYCASLQLAPTYNGAYTVTRHNYLDINNVAGSSTVTDAAVIRFNAAAGTHKALDSGTTKTTPSAVSAWVKINVNGTICYVPAYTSKTA